MKENFQLLIELLKEHDLSCFYDVSVTSYKVSLQGNESNQDCLNVAETMNVQLSRNPNNKFLEGVEGSIRIVLT